jgi:rubrerythrin
MSAAKSAVTQEHTEQRDLPTTDMYQCSVCNRTYHWSCLKQLQYYKKENRTNIDAQSDWSCPACHDLSLDEKEAR